MHPGVTPYHRRLAPGQSACFGSPRTLLLVTAGACRGRDHAISATAGSALLLAQAVTLVAAAPGATEVVCFDVAGAAPSAGARWSHWGRSEVEADERLGALFLLLSREQDADVAAALVDAFLLVTARSTGAPPAARDPIVARALDLMRSNLAQRLTVAALARRVGLSRAAFCRRFQAALGAPPERTITELRMRRAAELLATTDLGLAAIAAEVGYASEHALGRAFKRWSGIAPGRYRSRQSVRTRCLAA